MANPTELSIVARGNASYPFGTPKDDDPFMLLDTEPLDEWEFGVRAEGANEFGRMVAERDYEGSWS